MSKQLTPLTKGQLVQEITERTNARYGEAVWSKADVKTVMESMADVVNDELNRAGLVRIPEVAVLKLRYRAALPKRKTNSFGVERLSPARPASMAVKAAPATVLRRSVPSVRSEVGVALAKDAARKATARTKRAKAKAKA